MGEARSVHQVPSDRFLIARTRMVETQILTRGVKDPRVIEAMVKVPRHLFVEPIFQHEAYNDYPLPIGEDQTISQPYIVAVMTEYLDVRKDSKVLEIGTGSGYQTAILAELAPMVYTVERIESLGLKAHKRLNELGYGNIIFKIGQGENGLKEYAPFDRILVSAAAEIIPVALIEQLAEKGKMVIPLGYSETQRLTLIVKTNGRIKQRPLLDCSFVPLIKGGA